MLFGLCTKGSFIPNNYYYQLRCWLVKISITDRVPTGAFDVANRDINTIFRGVFKANFLVVAGGGGKVNKYHHFWNEEVFSYVVTAIPVGAGSVGQHN